MLVHHQHPQLWGVSTITFLPSRLTIYRFEGRLHPRHAHTITTKLVMADAAGLEALAFRSVDEVLAENRRNASDVFRRFPVDSDAGEIRLLSLDCGGWDDPIRTEFQVAGRPEERLSDDGLVQYNAVPYVWGADDGTGGAWRYRISL